MKGRREMRNKTWLIGLVCVGLMTENTEAMLADDYREVRIPRIRDDARPVLHAPKQDAQTPLEQSGSFVGAPQIFPVRDTLGARLPDNDSDIDGWQTLLGATEDRQIEDIDEPMFSRLRPVDGPTIGINDGNAVQTSQDVTIGQQTVSSSRIGKSTLSKLAPIESDIRRIAENTKKLKEMSAEILCVFDDRKRKKASVMSSRTIGLIQDVFWTMAETVGNVVTGTMALAESCQAFGQIMDEAIDINNKLKDLATLEDPTIFELKSRWPDLMPQIFYFARGVDGTLAEILKHVIKKISSATADQIILDADETLQWAQALINDCCSKYTLTTWRRMHLDPKQIYLLPEEYPVFSERIHSLMIAITNIEENWQSLDPIYRIATDENLLYEQLINDESKILSALAAGASTQSDGGSVLISQIKDFANTVKAVSERAKSRARDCNRNLRRRVTRYLQRTSECLQAQTHTD
jgi:hypothetical protein